MKRLLFIISMISFLAVTSFGQIDNTVDKGAGWIYFSGVPGLTVDVNWGAETAINLNDGTAWLWDRTSGQWLRWYNFDQGTGAPSGYVSGSPKSYLDSDSGLWYWYNGLAWEILQPWNEEQIQDLVGGMFDTGSHTGVNINYNDATGSIDVIVTGGGGVGTVDSLIELGDVSLTSPIDSAIFIFDSGLGKWRDDISLSTLLTIAGGITSVSTDATLTGDGTGGSPLSIAQQGAGIGDPLEWTGLAWEPGTDAVDDADADPINEIQYLTLNNIGDDRQIIIGTLTTPTDTILFSVDDGDADATNERNTAFEVSGGALEITDSGGTLSVDISDLAFDGDSSTTNEIQTFDLWNFTAGNNLEASLTNDATTFSVSLAGLEESQDLTDSMAVIRALIPGTFAGLDDVQITTPADSALVFWDNANNRFVDGPTINELRNAALNTEAVEDAVALMFLGGSHDGASFSYSDNGLGTGYMNLTISGGGVGVDSLVDLFDVTVTSPLDSTLLFWDSASGQWIDGVTVSELRSGATLTQEQVEDFVGGMFSGNTETLISVTYQDGDGTIDLEVEPNLSNYTNDAGFVNGTELTDTAAAIRADFPAGGPGSANGYVYNGFVVGNSCATGTEDSTNVGYSLLPNLFSFNRWINEYQQAVPDTNLLVLPGFPGGRAYTNIPDQFINDARGNGLGTERANRHGNTAYWLAWNLANQNPNDTVRLNYANRGGVLLDSMINAAPLYRDSILAIAQQPGVDRYDFFVLGVCAQENLEEFPGNVKKLWQYLRDTISVVDDATLFIIQGTDNNRELNGVSRMLAAERPNWHFVPWADNIGTIDGVHYPAQAHKDMGAWAYQIFEGRFSNYPIDTLNNFSAGGAFASYDGSFDNFLFTRNFIGNTVDSLQNNIILATGVNINFDNFVRNNVIQISNAEGSALTLNNNSNSVFYGVEILSDAGIIRDSMTLIGRRISSTRGDVIGIGHRISIEHTGSDIFGRDRTTTRNFQLMLGDTATDYVFIGPYEFDFSGTPTAGEENYVFAWNNASGTFTLEPQSGAGGGISSFNWGDGTTTTVIGDGETIQIIGGVNGIDVVGGGTNNLTANLDFGELTDAASVGANFEFAGWDSGTGIESRLSDNEVQTWVETFANDENLYNSNGSLSGNRIITGGGFSLIGTGFSGLTLSATGGASINGGAGTIVSLTAGSAGFTINALGGTSLESAEVSADSMQTVLTGGWLGIIDSNNSAGTEKFEFGAGGLTTGAGTYQTLFEIERDGSVLFGVNPAFRDALDTILVIDPATGEIFAANKPGAGSGDNLGNHTATTTLDMADNVIDDVQIIQFNDSDATEFWAIYEKGVSSGAYDAGGIWFQTSGTGTPLVAIERNGEFKLDVTPTTNNSNTNVLVYNSTTKAFEINTTISGGGGGLAYEFRGGDIVGDAASYVEFYRDTIEAGDFTTAGAEAYFLKGVFQITNETTTEFWDYRVRVDDGATVQTLCEIAGETRIPAGSSEYGTWDLVIMEDPDGTEDIVGGLNIGLLSGSFGDGGLVTVDDKEGRLIIIFEHASSEEGDTGIEMINAKATIEK
jgi:hypothetical protein